MFEENKARLQPLLQRLASDGVGHWIGGKRVESLAGATFETHSPVDRSLIAKVARGDAADIAAAAAAAKAAFPA